MAVWFLRDAQRQRRIRRERRRARAHRSSRPQPRATPRTRLVSPAAQRFWTKVYGPLFGHKGFIDTLKRAFKPRTGRGDSCQQRSWRPARTESAAPDRPVECSLSLSLYLSLECVCVCVWGSAHLQGVRHRCVRNPGRAEQAVLEDQQADRARFHQRTGAGVCIFKDFTSLGPWIAFLLREGSRKISRVPVGSSFQGRLSIHKERSNLGPGGHAPSETAIAKRAGQGQ